MLTSVFGNGTVWKLTAFPGFAGTFRLYLPALIINVVIAR